MPDTALDRQQSSQVAPRRADLSRRNTITTDAWQKRKDLQLLADFLGKDSSRLENGDHATKNISAFNPWI
jgi:hypothetical protein